VRILRVFERNTSDVRIIVFTTNQFLQELSCQIKTTHHPIPNSSHDVDDGEDEFCDGKCV
jgi:hypothetical protein